MHSVGLEPTKLILIGTRTTYQSTGDAGCNNNSEKIYHRPQVVRWYRLKCVERVSDIDIRVRVPGTVIF